tara:strand:- start:1665 stop:2189 length:525 start_codon:yes stop_codon:yes gene_type:complete
MTISDVVEHYKLKDPEHWGAQGYIYLLYSLALATNAQLIYEIGVNGARSTHAFLCAMQITGGQLWSCDVVDYDHRVTDEKLRKHWGFFHTPAAEWRKSLSSQCDIVFIDGHHNYEFVSEDVENFWPFVKKGGLMVLHDTKYMERGPGEVFRELKEQGVEIIDLPTQHGIAVARK